MRTAIEEMREQEAATSQHGAEKAEGSTRGGGQTTASGELRAGKGGQGKSVSRSCHSVIQADKAMESPSHFTTK